MKKINNYIQERLHITKDTGKDNLYKFEPKEITSSWYSLINGLEVSLPFTIIINGSKKIKIVEIKYSDEFGFDAWRFIDENNKQVIGVTISGIHTLFIKKGENQHYLYDDTTHSERVTLLKDSCNINMPT